MVLLSCGDFNRRDAEFAETCKIPLIPIHQPEKPGKLNQGLIVVLRPSSSVRSATLRFIARKFQGLIIQLQILTTEAQSSQRLANIFVSSPLNFKSLENSFGDNRSPPFVRPPCAL
jgi:hypothetical protein